MNDLETINSIINNAVKDSSYVTVLISSCVFIAYTVIIKIVEVIKNKDRNKPLLQMASAIKDISENVVKLNQVLDKTIKDAETKEIGRITNVITAALNSFKYEICDQCIDIMIHNNIEANKDGIEKNLYQVVSTEYYKVYSIFSAYEHNSVNVSTKIKQEWIDEVTKSCLQIIYNGQEVANRIRQLNHKLTITIDEYAIFINNKVFNH